MKAGKHSVDRARKNDIVLILLDRESVKEGLSKGSLVFRVGQKPRKIFSDPDTIPLLPPLRVFNIHINISKQGLTAGYTDYPESALFSYKA